jgi:hypothetical protein
MLVTAVRQDNSPVQIVGFRLSDQVGGSPVILVHNRTSLGTWDFSFSNLLGNPGTKVVLSLRVTDGRLFSHLLRRLQLQPALVLFEKRPQSIRNIQ